MRARCGPISPTKLSTFDEGFAGTIGVPTTAFSFGLVVTAAVAAVATFDAVGSIIVIAMFTCPPGAARLMTNRLEVQVLWSVVFATLSATIGYVLAGYGPLWLGSENAVSAAGMIATVSGIILRLTCLFAPHRARLSVFTKASEMPLLCGLWTGVKQGFSHS